MHPSRRPTHGQRTGVFSLAFVPRVDGRIGQTENDTAPRLAQIFKTLLTIDETEGCQWV